MKLIKKYIFIVLAVAASTLSACSGIFDELAVNPNQNDINGFYSTPENINKGVIGIYGYTQTPRAMGANGMGLLYNRGDEGSARGDYVSPGQYTVNLTPSFYSIVEPFSMFFTSISQSCQMIDIIPGVSFNNEVLKNAYLGEAYFLRAFAHFFLLTHYRNIPMMKELPKSAREYRPLAKPEEVWDLIIADLTKAKSLLPKKGYWKTIDIGRVTSGSAAALLGKAYLYRTGIEKKYGNSTKTYYTEAAAAFNEVIKGDHGAYALVSNYNWNFDVAHENNDESLFEIQFRADVVNTGFNPGVSNAGLFISPNGLQPPHTDRYANNQDQVTHDWLYNAFVASKDANNKTDSRMFGTFIFDDTKTEIAPKAGDVVKVLDGKTFLEVYPNGFASVNAAAGKYKASGRKWLDWTLPTVNPGGANNNMYFFFVRAQGTNYRAIRYADVLLMYAEAVLMGGTQGVKTPAQAVNDVRARASVDMPALGTVTMDDVKKERILELSCEGHRFFDLLRWGEVVTRFSSLQASDPNFKAYNTSPFLGFKEGKHEWLPLPIDEVNGNPYINSNNPGW